MRYGANWHSLGTTAVTGWALMVCLLAVAGCSRSTVGVQRTTATATAGTTQEQALTRLAQAAAGMCQ